VNLHIRRAVEADLPEVLSLWHAAGAESTHTDDLASLRRLYAHDPEALLVASDGDRLVGSVVAAWDGWRGSIYRLVVAPAARRQGVAARLVRGAERRLATVGARRLQAVVVASDTAATGFWRSTRWEQQPGRLRFTNG
jgi:ribosomal protein S18 acetylase RimI-like enzyme